MEQVCNTVMISREEYNKLDSIASELQDTCHKQAQQIAKLKIEYDNRTKQLSDVARKMRLFEAVIKSHGIPYTMINDVEDYEMGDVAWR